MDVAVLVAAWSARNDEWPAGDVGDGLLRLAVTLFAVTALVLTLETRSLHWLWAVLA